MIAWESEMGLHQNDANKKTDDLFDNGRLDYLVVGNRCRLLDGRRTEGYIEEIHCDEGYFRWRITK